VLFMLSYLVLIYIMSFHFVLVDYSIVQFQSLPRTYAQSLYTIPIFHPLLLNIRRRILLPTMVLRICRIPRLRRTDTAAFEITCLEGSKKTYVSTDCTTPSRADKENVWPAKEV
jgi:hypothetical protein